MRTLLLFLALSTLVVGPVAAETLGLLRGGQSAHVAPGWTRTYPVYDESWNVVGTHSWRVANNTGNCCENHLIATPAGRLYDIGGNEPVFTDDGGVTWKAITSVVNPLSGEGSAAYAPNGDFVGMSWDPYSGDRVVTFKHNAAENQWYVSVVALHSPFFDRPWLGVVPGPFTFGGTTYPYLSLMIGGWPYPTIYVSYDGLTYLQMEERDVTSFNGAKTGWLDQPAVAWADWVQPIAHAKIAPLPSGGALFVPQLCTWARLDPDGSAGCFRFPNGATIPATSVIRFDSLGRVHTFSLAFGSFQHRMSTDGGRSWQTTTHPLPPSHTVDSFDAVVNGALDVAAVSLRLDNTAANPDYSRILVYKISNLSTTTPDTLVYQVGDADRWLSSGITATTTRMDFQTVVLLPDGRIATSFSDLKHAGPRVAVQVSP